MVKGFFVFQKSFLSPLDRVWSRPIPYTCVCPPLKSQRHATYQKLAEGYQTSYQTGAMKKRRKLPEVIKTITSRLPKITVPDFLMTLSAMHFASLVASPVQDRSGLMLVAPSGSLKSALLIALERMYPNTCICDSNWYYSKIVKMRSLFYNGAVRSIVIPELASLYAGDPRTGGRMEQLLQQMAGEGCKATNEKDSRWERYEMRVSVFAAMTPEFAARKNEGWEQGFHRRFIWAFLAMENEEVLLDYLNAGKQVVLDVPLIIEPPEKYIPSVLSYEEKRLVRGLLSKQKDFGPNHTRFIFLCRTAAVLKWHFSRVGSSLDWKKVLKNFSACLGSDAALLVIPDEPEAIAYRKKMDKAARKENHQ
jgi:hypothetical protein